MGKLVAVVGNAGVGKTTLTQQLCVAGSFATGLEQHIERPFQAQFAIDRRTSALANQIDYLLLRAEQERAIRQGLSIGVQDGGLDEDFHVFTRFFVHKGYLSAEEYGLCERLYNFTRHYQPAPDLIIHLTAPLDVLIERHARRKRPVEIVAATDLADLEALVDEWIAGVTTPVLRVDAGADRSCFADIVPELLGTIGALLGGSPNRDAQH